MKENIHPNYKKTTITCACGEVIETSSTKENIRVKFVPNATRSSPVSKNWLIPADVWIVSNVVSV